MKTNLTIQELKRLLPHGSYKRIVEISGVSYPTVYNFFNERCKTRIDARLKIIEASKDILKSIEI